MLLNFSRIGAGQPYSFRHLRTQVPPSLIPAVSTFLTGGVGKFHSNPWFNMRAVGLTALVAASVVGVAVFPTPASSQLSVITHGFSLDEATLVKEAGNRRGWIHATRPRSHETFATRPYHYRPNYRYFGADPDRYFGIGPGSYECFGYDCNW